MLLQLSAAIQHLAGMKGSKVRHCPAVADQNPDALACSKSIPQAGDKGLPKANVHKQARF